MKQQRNTRMAMVFAAMVFFAAIPSTTAAQDSRFPRPDFSEMEKWYSINSWTYDKYGTIKMDIQAKNNPPQTNRLFVIKYFDKNGKEMVGYTIMGVGYSTPKDQVEHVEAYGISEDKIKTVKSIIIYHLNEDGTYTGPAVGQVPQVETPVIHSPVREPVTKDPPANINQGSGCNFNVLPAPDSRAPFSETLAKNALYERYGFEVNTGGLSSPLAIGLTFLGITTRGSYINTVTVVPGRGAQRKQDIAPVNATIYSFHASYIVCKKYNNAITRTQYDSNNICFKAANGNWQCVVEGAPKIVTLADGK